MATETDVGQQIRKVRTACGMASKDLANAVGLNSSALSRIESGQRNVSSTELAEIADALNVSPMVLLEPNSAIADMAIAPRTGSESPTVYAPNDPVKRRLTGFVELAGLLKPLSPQPQLDDFPTKGDWLQLAALQARWARRQLGIENDHASFNHASFNQIAQQIEAVFGFDVIVESHQDGLVGATIKDGTCPMIFVNAEQQLNRARFTLAHELHHALDPNITSSVYDTDLVGQTERNANAFAACFLMPEEAVRQQAAQRDGRGLAAMVATFGVSFNALVYRLHNLSIIDRDGRDKLLEAGYSGLLDTLTEHDAQLRLQLSQLQTLSPAARRPSILTDRAIEGYRTGQISIRPVADLLGEAPEILSEMLGTANLDAASYFDAPQTPGTFQQRSPDDLEEFYTSAASTT